MDMARSQYSREVRVVGSAVVVHCRKPCHDCNRRGENGSAVCSPEGLHVVCVDIVPFLESHVREG